MLFLLPLGAPGQQHKETRGLSRPFLFKYKITLMTGIQINKNKEKGGPQEPPCVGPLDAAHARGAPHSQGPTLRPVHFSVFFCK